MADTIEVVDLVTGIVDDLSFDSPTLDIPDHFDREGAGLSLDADNRGRHTARGGGVHIYRAVEVMLSKRGKGEECLVGPASADEKTGTRTFHLSMVVHGKPGPPVPVIWHRFGDDAEARRALDAGSEGGISLTVPSAGLQPVAIGSPVIVLFSVAMGTTFQAMGTVQMTGPQWTVGFERQELATVESAIASGHSSAPRNFARSPCWLQATVQLPSGRLLHVTACNLGLGGAALTALHAPLAEGAEVGLRFGDYPRAIRARVAWCSEEGTAGLTFLDPPAARALMQRLGSTPPAPGR